MGFLTEAARDEDPNDPDKGAEEMYMEIFAKIARDFVHREDLKLILLELLVELGLEGNVPTENDTAARERAKEYRSMLDQGKQGNEIYPDLIPASEGVEEDGS